MTGCLSVLSEWIQVFKKTISAKKGVGTYQF
jgi:hypothetical protein